MDNRRTNLSIFKHPSTSSTEQKEVDSSSEQTFEAAKNASDKTNMQQVNLEALVEKLDASYTNTSVAEQSASLLVHSLNPHLLLRV